jgi:hypothetical protein
MNYIFMRIILWGGDNGKSNDRRGDLKTLHWRDLGEWKVQDEFLLATAKMLC